MSNIGYALWITLIGMGLVFIALLLLWGLMEGLMKFTAWYNVRNPEGDEEEEEEGEEETPEADTVETPAPSILKQRAAAAAVAAALALHQTAATYTGPANKGGPEASNWQAAMRAAQLSQRSFHFTRKTRGNAR